MTDPQRIYRSDYATGYDSIYLHPWRHKHEVNQRLLSELVAKDASQTGLWLDLGCGQAWQFSRFPRGNRLGVDLSPAQLTRARRRNPRARFVCADMTTFELPPKSCHLVTCFWGAYCYLDDPEAILNLLRRAVGWLERGGALYFEVLPPENLSSFNASEFASATGFRVAPRTPDYTRWSYDDPGGRHLMASPPSSSFLEILRPAFDQIDVEETGFMFHLVARGRK